MKLKVLLAVVFAVCVNKASAQTPALVVAGDPQAVPNGGLLENVSVPFQFRLQIDNLRSYCCTAIADNADARITSIDSELASSVPFAYRGASPPRIPSHGMPGPATGGRACFFATTHESHLITVNATPLNSVSSFDKVSIGCEETTLFGGFNTAASELNFLEITNHHSAEVQVKVRGYDEMRGGQQVIDLQFTIGNVEGRLTKRVDIDLHSLVGPGAFGPLEITHDAPSGVVSARVSQYDVITAEPLTFRLVGQTEFKTRNAAN